MYTVQYWPHNYIVTHNIQPFNFLVGVFLGVLTWCVCWWMYDFPVSFCLYCTVIMQWLAYCSNEVFLLTEEMLVNMFSLQFLDSYCCILLGMLKMAALPLYVCVTAWLLCYYVAQHNFIQVKCYLTLRCLKLCLFWFQFLYSKAQSFYFYFIGYVQRWLPSCFIVLVLMCHVLQIIIF